ncbi:MAG: transglycosylase [Robiginitomaculum sp.]|nr:MAG: transglycosylase [Robiginitomaculum sp.]
MIFFKHIRISLKFIMGLAVFASMWASIASAANAPIPRVKPEAPNTSQLLSMADARNFRRGMRAADIRQWDNVERYVRRIKDPTAIRILNWRLAADDPAVSFKVLTDVIHNQSGWPRMTRIKSKGEIHLFDRPIPANDAIAWFMGTEPVSGEGRAAMAQAHYKLGQTDIADKWLRSAWRESRLSRDRQKRLFSRYKDRLSPGDHAARADHLIWLGKRYYGSAGGLLSLMTTSDKNLMDARMRVGANRSGMDRAIRRIPATSQDDTGLLFERARWRRTRKSEAYALPVYLQITTPPNSETGKKRLWREKKRMTYWALKEKNYENAYTLTLHHGFTSGPEFADAEFLSGWIALTKLNQPAVAAMHFATLKNGVGLPVSLGRASYWQGRAAEALGDSMSVSYYADAARYPNVYYSQLAAERLNQGYAYTNLPSEEAGWTVTPQFENQELVRALRMIGEIQSERTYNQFSFHMDDILQDPRELSQLAKLGKGFGFMKPSVRAAKQAGRLHTMLTESGYPKPDIVTNLPAHFDIPFVLAIARQESEFNAKASSHAKAYGMMQMINSTARVTARRAKIPYQRSWLTSDPEYAARLGAQHLHDLLREFDGSYIMAAAAYNAGGHRVRQWNKTYGDPRLGQIDPIDWLESLPFSETRNYIQRVMENLEVYRARLNNNQAELRLLHDITNGAFR